jgi:hypothetical protein
MITTLNQGNNDHERRFPTRYAKFGDSPLVSLDEALFDDGSTTRGDTVSRGLWVGIWLAMLGQWLADL